MTEQTDAAEVTLDIEGVLAGHRAIVSGDEDGWHVVCTCGHRERGDSTIPHVAAVLREQMRVAALRLAADELERAHLADEEIAVSWWWLRDRADVLDAEGERA